MTPEDKLAAYERVIAQCQAILARLLQPHGLTEKDTITALWKSWTGPRPWMSSGNLLPSREREGCSFEVRVPVRRLANPVGTHGTPCLGNRV